MERDKEGERDKDGKREMRRGWREIRKDGER